MTASIRTIEGTPYRIVEQGGLRRLMMVGDDVATYSEMLLGAPDVLVTATTRLMLNALPFAPRLDDILMIGLGGGQQARLLHRRLAATRLVCVDADPASVHIARSWFGLPPDDARLQVVIGDGEAYVNAHAQCCDLLLCDGYDPQVPPVLASSGFYAGCHAALRPGGVMALHLDRRCPFWRSEQLRTLQHLFAHHIELPVDQDQSVLLLFRDAAGADAAAVMQRARALDALLDLGLGEFVARLGD